ncbi:hypothetical protein [Microbacterium testaceum]|uniref:hypothetical protein n=1 Tax=Microbacterium testaceum TaxID=2033 RepID=UPI001CD96C91|nr:hypothetical protein [Microbacterium testaceum]
MASEMVGFAKMMSSSGWAQTVSRVDDPSHPCAAGEAGGGGGTGVEVGVGVEIGGGVEGDVVVGAAGVAEAAGDAVDTGSGRSRAKPRIPATAIATMAATAMAAIRPADALRRRGEVEGVEARGIGTFRADGGGDPAVRHDLAGAELG